MSSSTGAVAGRHRARPVALIIAVLVLADIVSAFESTMMFNALPRLISEFHVTAVDASWVLTAFALVAAASAAVCGRLGDIYGRRRLLLVLLIASGAGSVVSIVSGTLPGVIAGRAIQGIAGGILPLCFGLIREHLPSKHIPVGVAMLASTSMLAGASGTIVSGVLIDTLSWHYIFVLAAVVAAVAAAGTALLPPSTATATVTRVDWLGAVLFVPAISLMLFGITNATRWTWGDGRTLGTVLGGLALLACWVWWELRTRDPLIDIRLFLDRNQGLTLLTNAILSAGVFGTTGLIIQLIMQTPTSAPVGLGMSATVAGAVTFAITSLCFFLSPVSGRIAARFGGRRALVIGTVFGVLAAAAFAFLHDTIPGMICAVLVLNIGLAFMLTALPNLVVEGVPAEHTSAATGVNQVARTAFSGVGSAIASLILSLSLVPGTPFGTAGAYNGVFAVVAGASVVALVLSLFIRARTGTSAAAQPVSP